MRSFVVGTAGHIDHGKSTLVRALTGTDPDRLAEEKLRGMTIELGFARLTTPAGREVGMVDVPGHERFVKTMLAGVGGIDAALLVVAADEGPMPQTDEHLAILTLLGVDRGVVALSKADLVEPDWAAYVAEELRERLADSGLASAEIVAVSAATGEGLDALGAALDRALGDAPERRAGGSPRLPVDRVFTMAGFGTVVTGTLVDGELAVGMEVELAPGGRRSRVRGLQSHGAWTERATPGRRVAVNLQGVAVEEIARGDVVTLPGTVPATTLVDVRLRVVRDAPVSLKHGAVVDVFSGSAESPARLALIEREVLEPGEEGWAQVRLVRPMAVLKGDRLVIRRPSPSATLGGGVVVDAHPARHRRTETGVAARLETLAAGTPAELVRAALGSDVLSEDQVAGRLPSLPAATVREAVEATVGAGSVRRAVSGHLVASAAWASMAARIVAEVGAYHRANPLRRGMPREEVRSRLTLGGGQTADAVVGLAIEDGLLVAEERTVRLPDFRIALPSEQEEAAARYLALVDATPYSPPAASGSGVTEQTLAALVERGELVDVGDGIVFRPAMLERIKAEVLALIEGRGKITLADYRDAVGTTRKYAQATLEHLDGLRVTRRVGDERFRGR